MERLNNPYIEANYNNNTYSSINNQAIKIKIQSKDDLILLQLKDGFGSTTSKSEIKILIRKLLVNAGDKKFWSFPIKNSEGKTFTV